MAMGGKHALKSRKEKKRRSRKRCRSFDFFRQLIFAFRRSPSIATSLVQWSRKGLASE
jgi:hypothetical protein